MFLCDHLYMHCDLLIGLTTIVIMISQQLMLNHVIIVRMLLSLSPTLLHYAHQNNLSVINVMLRDSYLCMCMLIEHPSTPRLSVCNDMPCTTFADCVNTMLQKLIIILSIAVYACHDSSKISFKSPLSTSMPRLVRSLKMKLVCLCQSVERCIH